MNYNLPSTSVYGIFQARTGVGCHFLLQVELSDPGMEPQSPALQADSLPNDLPGKP